MRKRCWVCPGWRDEIQTPGEPPHQLMRMFRNSVLAFHVGEVDVFSFDVGNEVTCGLRRAASPVRLFRIFK